MSGELPFAPVNAIIRRNAGKLRVSEAATEELARRIQAHGTGLAVVAAERATAAGRKTLMSEDFDAEPPDPEALELPVGQSSHIGVRATGRHNLFPAGGDFLDIRSHCPFALTRHYSDEHQGSVQLNATPMSFSVMWRNAMNCEAGVYWMVPDESLSVTVFEFLSSTVSGIPGPSSEK